MVNDVIFKGVSDNIVNKGLTNFDLNHGRLIVRKYCLLKERSRNTIFFFHINSPPRRTELRRTKIHNKK